MAEADYNEVLRLEPKHANALYRRGLAESDFEVQEDEENNDLKDL